MQREAEQLQADQPALRASGRILDDVCRELNAHHLLEEGHDLFRRAAQLVGSHFQHLSTRSQQRQWQRRIGACGQHEVQLKWKMLQKINEGVVNLWPADYVIVVQNQEKLLGPTRQNIDECLQDVAQGRHGCLLHVQIGKEWSAETRLPGVQRGERIVPEQHRLIIFLVQRNPGHTGSIGVLLWERMYPGRKECGLAEAGGSSDEREFAS